MKRNINKDRTSKFQTVVIIENPRVGTPDVGGRGKGSDPGMEQAGVSADIIPFVLFEQCYKPKTR